VSTLVTFKRHSPALCATVSHAALTRLLFTVCELHAIGEYTMTSKHQRAAIRRSSKEMFALKEHVANICFKCFRDMLQMLYIDVTKVNRDAAKVDRDVAHVAMYMHKCMFQMFHLYQT
jgi:hypothetical protein